MVVRYHRPQPELFRALAAGEGGPDAVQELSTAQYSKHLILLQGVLAAAPGVSQRQGRLARQGYDLLCAVQRCDPAAAESTIRHPGVGAWALRTIRAARGERAMPGAEPAQLTAVAAAAAIHAGLNAEIVVPAPTGAAVLPSLGGAVVGDSQDAVIRSGHAGAEVVSTIRTIKVPPDPYQDAPSWRGLRRIRAGALNVVVDDVDPFRMPGSGVAAPRLSGAEVLQWEMVLRRAWRLLEAHHQDFAAEAAAALKVIVPLSTPESGQISSSSAEAYGAVAMSKPLDPTTCAATIVHEVQHLKLFALIDMVTLTIPDDGQRFYAPWRDDPRPVSGLLQGAYAHLGLSRFWRERQEIAQGSEKLRAQRELARWLPATSRAVETLRSSRCLTPAGLNFTVGMQEALLQMRVGPIPKQARDLARQDAERHLARWQRRNGPLRT